MPVKDQTVVVLLGSVREQRSDVPHIYAEPETHGQLREVGEAPFKGDVVIRGCGREEQHGVHVTDWGVNRIV